MMSDVTFSVNFKFGKNKKNSEDCDRFAENCTQDIPQEGLEKWLDTAQKFVQAMRKKHS